MAFETRNRGALFNNSSKKQKDTDPDYGGDINIEGVDYWLSAWLKTGKDSGVKFLSLSARPKRDREGA